MEMTPEHFSFCVVRTMSVGCAVAKWFFSLHSAPEEFKNATNSGHFGFVFEKNSVREIT